MFLSPGQLQDGGAAAGKAVRGSWPPASRGALLGSLCPQRHCQRWRQITAVLSTVSLVAASATQECVRNAVLGPSPDSGVSTEPEFSQVKWVILVQAEVSEPQVQAE